MGVKLKERSEIYYTALYIRLSCEDGDREESDSVVNQKKLLQSYILSREEFVLYDIYVDDGYSGTNFKRPAFERMIQDIEQGNVNCVLVKDLSRFGRDYIDTGRYLERFFPEHEVRFISVADGIDSMKQVYDLMLPIKNIFNEQYARDISRKIQATISQKQRDGEFIGSFASYGYKKSETNRNKLVIDEYAAEIVRRIFSMYLQGYGKQKIARILTQEGVLCPSAYKMLNGSNYKNHNYKNDTYWTYSTINTILHKEIYAGNMVQGTKHQDMRKKQKLIDQEDWIVVENTHEPIIDQETWEKTQSLLSKRTRKLDLESDKHIFAGFVKCGTCGRPMARIKWKNKNGTSNTRLYCGTYKRFGKEYCTPHSIPAGDLEKIVINDLKMMIRNVESLEPYVREQLSYKAEKTNTSRQLAKLYEEQKKILRLKKSVYEDYKEDIISKEEYMIYRQDYRQKEEMLSKQIALMEKPACDSSENIADYPWIKKLLELKEIEELNRTIVVEMISEVVVFEDRKVKIVYNFSDEMACLFSEDVHVRN